MAEHRALQVLRAVKSALVDATRAKSNVEIGRQTNVDENDAIDIIAGPDLPVTEFGTDNNLTIDSILRVYVDLHTRSVETNPEKVLEALFEMRAQSHVALLADISSAGLGKVGLAFVVGMRYAGTDQLLTEQGGDRIGAVRTVWDCAYRMAYSDPAT
jgi:hypothetical protein